MTNPYRAFEGLRPGRRLLIGEVTAHNADGTSTVELLDSRTIRARGQSVAVSSKAFVRAGLIEGEAPNLPSFDLTV